jgi:hypothetical protein
MLASDPFSKGLYSAEFPGRMCKQRLGQACDVQLLKKLYMVRLLQ